jgi:hypothetical protein
MSTTLQAPVWPTQAQSTPVSAACSCTRSAALTVQRGATLSTKIKLTVTDDLGVKSPVNLTGCEFQFTAKPTPDTPDDDPLTVKIDWSETVTPLEGFTWLVVPALTTQDMLEVSYVMQVRMVSPSGVVTPIVGGSLTVTEPPASARFD